MIKLIRDLKIIPKIMTSTGIFLVLLLITGGAGILSIKVFEKLLNNFSQNYLPKTDNLDQADRDLIQLQVAERSLLNLEPGSEFEKFIFDYEENLQQSYERLEVYRKLMETDEEKELFSLYEQARSDWLPVSRSVIDLCKQYTSESREHAKKVSFVEAAEKFEIMRNYINQLEEINLELSNQANIASKKLQEKVTAVFIFLIVFGLLVTCLTLWMLTTVIANPLRNVTEMLKDISQGEGDLTKKLDDTSKDEIGELARYFNLFVAKLVTIIKNLSSNTANIAESSGILKSTSTILASSAEEMTNQTMAVASSSEQTSANIKEISKSAENMSDSVAHFASAIEEMSSSIQEVSRNCQHELQIATDVNQKILTTQEKMSELDKSAKEIGKIIGVITDIADQTNLLALNATIEAASAGESGKGFAVVASEVKALATQTTSSTEEIKHIIEQIQNNSAQSIEDIHSVAKTISEVHDISQTIASSMEEQSATINEVAKEISTTRESALTVTNNVKDSSGGLAEISENIHGIQSASSDVAKKSEELQSNAVILSNTSSELEKIVNQFKT